MGFGTRDLARRGRTRCHFFQRPGLPRGRPGSALPGGVLIWAADGTTLDALGASGDVADNDEACAVAGIKAVGLTPDPGNA